MNSRCSKDNSLDFKLILLIISYLIFIFFLIYVHLVNKMEHIKTPKVIYTFPSLIHLNKNIQNIIIEHILK